MAREMPRDVSAITVFARRWTTMGELPAGARRMLAMLLCWPSVGRPRSGALSWPGSIGKGWAVATVAFALMSGA